MSPASHTIPRIGEGIFTPRDIAMILHVDRRRVRYLLRRYLGEHYMDGDGVAINFKALIELQIFHLLRVEGYKVKEILEAHGLLSRYYKTRYPLASRALYKSGKELIVKLDDVFLKTDGTRQAFFAEIIIDFLRSVEFDKEGQPVRIHPKGFQSIVIDPAIQFGQPIIKDTRITVSNLAGMYKAGDSKQMLSNLFDLPPAKVQEAIRYWKQAAA